MDSEPVEIWPENEKSISLFSSVSTQWRIGMNGPTGLDYNVLLRLLDRMRLTDTEYDQLFTDVRVIEAEALTILNQKD